MLVRLQLDGFGAELCDLQPQKEGLQIIRNQKPTMFLPAQTIRSFQTEGQGKALKRFVLETDTELYEGRFLEQGDADRLIAYFQERIGWYMEVRLDTQ